MSIQSWQAGYKRRQKARDAGQFEAERASISGLVAGANHTGDISVDARQDWPVSGDDLALAISGKIS